MTQSEVQIGKKGITDNFIETLNSHFKKHSSVRINVLKSAGHTKENIKNYSEEILEKLGKKYTAKILGFIIFLKKWRKEIR